MSHEQQNHHLKKATPTHGPYCDWRDVRDHGGSLGGFLTGPAGVVKAAGDGCPSTKLCMPSLLGHRLSCSNSALGAFARSAIQTKTSLPPAAAPS
jgi:hypothetical protein